MNIGTHFDYNTNIVLIYEQPYKNKHPYENAPQTEVSLLIRLFERSGRLPFSSVYL